MNVTAREMKYLKRFADGGMHLSSEFIRRIDETDIYGLVHRGFVSGNGRPGSPYVITKKGRAILEIDGLKARRDAICPEMMQSHKNLMSRFGRAKKGYVSARSAGVRAFSLEKFGMLYRFYGKGLWVFFAPKEKGCEWININNQIIELEEKICNQE